jgi:transposase
MLGVDGFHVTTARRNTAMVVLTVETDQQTVGCPVCGVVARSRGRRELRLVDAPWGARRVVVVWRKRVWRCEDPDCPGRQFSECDDRLAEPGTHLTRRAVDWAVTQMRRENATPQGLARQFGMDWHTVWRVVKRRLETFDADPGRFADVDVLGVDEHVWHHVSEKKRGPRMFTGMVNLTGRHARLLDLVPGRSGTVYAGWLDQRGLTFRRGVKIAALDPFRGYKNAIDDKLDDARAVLDAFHIVKLGFEALDEVRRRVQQDTLGHRGRKGDPLYGIRRVLSTGHERLSARQQARLADGLALGDPNDEVLIAWQVAQQLRDAYIALDRGEGMRSALRLVRILPGRPIPEIARLGKTLRQWKPEYLAYWSTDGVSNGGTEAVNNLIELARRVARGFTNPNNYRLRMLLIGGAFDT